MLRFGRWVLIGAGASLGAALSRSGDRVVGAALGGVLGALLPVSWDGGDAATMPGSSGPEYGPQLPSWDRFPAEDPRFLDDVTTLEAYEAAGGDLDELYRALELHGRPGELEIDLGYQAGDPLDDQGAPTWSELDDLASWQT